ncbi:MAG: hypothetical protein ACE141_14395 [Bryobacteraceae bacterium]
MTRADYDSMNPQAACIIWGAPHLYGGEGAGPVRWAELYLRRHAKQPAADAAQLELVLGGSEKREPAK